MNLIQYIEGEIPSLENQDIYQDIKTTQFGIARIFLKESKKIGRYKMFKVQFLDTGYIDWATLRHAQKGQIKDFMAKTIYGIGYLGDKEYCNANYEHLYRIWNGMIGRCYHTVRKDYPRYGGKGTTVSNEWLCFKTFVLDHNKLPGWNKQDFDNGLLQLDKDKLYGNNKVYSKDTCCWLTQQENCLYRYTQRHFEAIDKDGNRYEHRDQTAFAKICGIPSGKISEILRRKRLSYNGWKFNYLD